MKYLTTIIIVVLLLPYLAKGQNNRDQLPEKPSRVLSYQELLEEIVNSKDSIYKLSNVILRLDINKDQRFLAFDSLSTAALDTVRIQTEIEIENVTLEGEYPLVISKVVFEKAFTFSQSELSETALVFNGVRFLSDLVLKSNQESTVAITPICPISDLKS